MTAIEFENISKQYRLGLVSTRTLSHDLNRWWQTAVLHREDPYLKIGETNDRATKGDSEYVWALRDINFKVEQGDVVGIIGKNGAGKSTLLKLLSRVTTPTIGVIRARGRIASLLEVGTGFHSELTGRENIYMNGTIMGMSKAEVTRKLDEIVDFSGCERYLDTPVKRYSSGMTVRLGFAVAAHLDPEILVVDEVLAVGDAEFQKKAIGKMQDVSRGEGRTVLFVSHNMQSIRNLCNSGVMLKNGSVAYIGGIHDVVDYYLRESMGSGIINHEWNIDDLTAPQNEVIQVLKSGTLVGDEHFTIKSAFKIYTEFLVKRPIKGLKVSMHLLDVNGAYVFALPSEEKNFDQPGIHRVTWNIPANFMNDGLYMVNNFFVSDKEKMYMWHREANSFEIHENREKSNWHDKWVGAVRPLGIVDINYE